MQLAEMNFPACPLQSVTREAIGVLRGKRVYAPQVPSTKPEKQISEATEPVCPSPANEMTLTKGDKG